jgi:hypothetical protein
MKDTRANPGASFSAKHVTRCCWVPLAKSVPHATRNAPPELPEWVTSVQALGARGINQGVPIHDYPVLEAVFCRFASSRHRALASRGSKAQDATIRARRLRHVQREDAHVGARIDADRTGPHRPLRERELGDLESFADDVTPEAAIGRGSTTTHSPDERRDTSDTARW